MSKTAENRRTLGMRKLSLSHRMKQIAMICFAVLFSVFSISAEATDPDISVNDTGTGMCIYDVLDTYSGSASLKARWEANEIGLYWYSDDTQITNVSNSANSCSYAGGLTVPASPTKTGYTFNGWKVRGLPDGYTRLEYIQSSGTQYINTGITGGARWLGKAQSVQDTTKSQGLLMGQSNGAAGSFVGSVGSGNKWTTWGTPNDTTYPITTVQEFDLSFSTSSVTGKIGNTDVSHTGLNISFNMTWKICCHTTSFPYIGKIFWLRAYQNNVLVRNFIPAKNSSNVVGMYDTVSKTFFTNAGSGTFTEGPVVN